MIEKNFDKKEIAKKLERDPGADYMNRLEHALQSDEYETAERALRKIQEINAFRRDGAASRFRDFYDLVEQAHYIAVNGGKEKEYLRRRLANEATLHLNKLTPRVRETYASLIANLNMQEVSSEREDVEKLLSDLQKDGVLDTLTLNKASLSVRQNNLETQLLMALKGLRRLDMREGHADDLRDKPLPEENKPEESEPAEPDSSKSEQEDMTPPPSANDESEPGVDPSERPEKNEKRPAFWAIEPGYGGYYQAKTLGIWDEATKKWKGDAVLSDRVAGAPLLEIETSEKFNLEMTAVLRAGEWVSLPVPYTHAYHNVEAEGTAVEVKQDQYGNIYLKADRNVKAKARLAYVGQRVKTDAPRDVAYFGGALSEQTQQKLEEIKTVFHTDEDRAQAVAAYVVSTLKYLKPKDHAEANHYNNLYRSHLKGFAYAVEEAGKGDCDVVNTYYALLCAKIGLHARHIVGHSVSGKDKTTGQSAIHSGTDHAWTEVWSREREQWLRIDATPPGDPNLQEDEGDENSEPAPGDFGEQTPENSGERGQEGSEQDGGEDQTKENTGKWTDERLAALEKRLQERVTELSYTAQERHLAEVTGIELKEARQIMREIAKAEALTLPNGEKIKDVLNNLFRQIVQSRKFRKHISKGPISQAMGGTRIMPGKLVQHTLQVRAGQPDPATRLRQETKEKKEDLFGGFDFYFIGDNTASTTHRVGENEMVVYELQRLAGYLTFSALHDFERELERRGVTTLSDEKSLDINTMGISYHGDGEVKVDKVFGKEFAPADKVRMWRSLEDIKVGAGADNALGFLANHIEEELAQKSADNRLRLVLFCSDGEFFGEETVHVKAHLDRLRDAGVVVVGVGLTEDAKNIPVIFRAAGHNGEYTADVNDLPKIIAKHIVSEAIKLFPEKAKNNLQQVIDNILRKFDQ